MQCIWQCQLTSGELLDCTCDSRLARAAELVLAAAGAAAGEGVDSGATGATVCAVVSADALLVLFTLLKRFVLSATALVTAANMPLPSLFLPPLAPSPLPLPCADSSNIKES